MNSTPETVKIEGGQLDSLKGGNSEPVVEDVTGIVGGAVDASADIEAGKKKKGSKKMKKSKGNKVRSMKTGRCHKRGSKSKKSKKSKKSRRSRRRM